MQVWRKIALIGLIFIGVVGVIGTMAAASGVLTGGFIGGPEFGLALCLAVTALIFAFRASLVIRPWRAIAFVGLVVTGVAALFGGLRLLSNYGVAFPTPWGFLFCLVTSALVFGVLAFFASRE